MILMNSQTGIHWPEALLTNCPSLWLSQPAQGVQVLVLGGPFFTWGFQRSCLCWRALPPLILLIRVVGLFHSWHWHQLAV